MVVDADVERRVVLVALDAQRGRLLAALVAAGRFAGGHRGDQALGQRQRGVREVRLGRGLDHLRAGEHVAGDAPAVAQAMAAPVDAGVAGVRRARAACGDHVELALRAAGIGGGERGDHVDRRMAGVEQLETGRPVQRVHQGLGGQRTGAAPRVHRERTDREEAAGDGDAEAAVAVACEDRPGHGDRPRDLVGRS